MSVYARQHTVLLADDDEQIRLMIARLLREAGFHVLVAEDGTAAERIAQTQHFDCLLTDIIMPYLDGLSLAMRLRATRADLPVIFVSGPIEAEMISNKISGALLIRKPFDPRRLVETVQRVLSELL